MPITLAQAKLLTQDKLCQYVIDEFRKDPLFELMVWDNTVNPNGMGSLTYTYNRLKTQPTADFRAINAEYTAQEADTTQVTVNLKPFGGSFKVDRVIQQYTQGVVNHVAMQLEQKIKATRALFADTLINGDTASNSNAFDGIEKAVTGSSTEISPSAAIDLSTSANITSNANSFMDELDRMLSLMSETPSALLVNRQLKAILNGIARRSGYFSTNDVDAFGAPVTKYAGVPILSVGDKPGSANPIIPVSEGVTCLYAVVANMDGVHGVSPNGSNVIATYLPDFKSPGAVKTGEVEMVAAIAIKATRSVAKLGNIRIATAG